jgi:S-adenosylmethionine hydrolase
MPQIDPIVTLTTDFGAASPYVAQMKGVLLGINPRVRLVDLSHAIPAQDVRHVSHFLAAAVPAFPEHVLHVVVVDPGVGSERRLLYVETGRHRLLVPDNGCWTQLARLAPDAPRVRRLNDPSLWRHPVSNTFHGRDILAPVAAHLSMGMEPMRLGPEVDCWVELDVPIPRFDEAAGTWLGEVLFVDDFGNLITNLGPHHLDALSPPVELHVGGTVISRRVRTYADARPGDLVFLHSSMAGAIEAAVVQGSAARRLGVGMGAAVRLVGNAPPLTSPNVANPWLS